LPKIAVLNCHAWKIATVTSQKEQSRTAKNGGALLLEKVPTEKRRRHIQIWITKTAIARSPQKRRRVVALALFFRLVLAISPQPRWAIS
jgi:hypothetical protein